METAGRMPGGSRGQLRAFKQHHIRPAQFGQMVQNGTSDYASADDCDSGGGFHDWAPAAVLKILWRGPR